MSSRLFEVRVQGVIAPEALASLGAIQAQVTQPQTILRGQVPDEAALHDLLLQLRDLGLGVIEVRRQPVHITDSLSGPRGEQAGWVESV